MTSEAPRYAPHPSHDPRAPHERAGRTFAIIAIVVAAIQLLLGVLVMVGQVILIRSSSIDLIGGMAAVAGGLGLLLSLLAIVLAVVSVVRHERAKVVAGVALGVGIAGIAGVLSGGIQTLLLSTL